VDYEKSTGLVEKAVNTDQPDTAASVTARPIAYRARCTEAGCKNVGRLLMIYADAGGRPIAHPVLCHAHGRERLERDKEAGLKVFDDREAQSPLRLGSSAATQIPWRN
jgi:hypothetical protein